MWKVIVWSKQYRAGWIKVAEKHYKREGNLLNYVWAQERAAAAFQLKDKHLIIYGRIA